MTTIISVLFGLACIWMSFVFNPLMILIGFFLLRLLGKGSMTFLPQTLVPHWFKQKRGLALSLLGIGGVISSSLLPPFNNCLINSYGLNFTWRFWAFLLIILMDPVGWYFIRSRPENIGLKPDKRILYRIGVDTKYMIQFETSLKKERFFVVIQ